MKGGEQYTGATYLLDFENRERKETETTAKQPVDGHVTAGTNKRNACKLTMKMNIYQGVQRKRVSVFV